MDRPMISFGEPGGQVAPDALAGAGPGVVYALRVRCEIPEASFASSYPLYLPCLR